ncbi:NnrU family protein [Galbibacter sp. EGI 63066]|uniref:methanethiol S-methyltransferase n=1 Tax=Galbibacter sp. EGI 63066 TaxID=2993559 RepID=UPI00224914A4|nr:methanethiol S-methyltransferase [Galbibacter sp. EGI 63066]MCX2681864.1 NnrU family protein [Galbibacter sp. EGI 63066]
MKALAFLYGIVSYLLFFVTFLYAIAFVGDFGVSKTIDTGEETFFGTAIIINIVVLSVFALQHSIMARQEFKRWWTKIIPPAIERSTYVLLSTLALILIFWQWRPMPEVVWEVTNPFWVGVLWGLFALGWLTVLLSTFMINHFDLFGLKQVYENLKKIPPKPVQFTTRWFYNIVRHPIMLGFVIAFWTTPVMTQGHLLFAVVTTVYILVAVKLLEERDLRKQFGDIYKEYQKKTPMLIPFTKWKK